MATICKTLQKRNCAKMTFYFFKRQALRKKMQCHEKNFVMATIRKILQKLISTFLSIRHGEGKRSVMLANSQ